MSSHYGPLVPDGQYPPFSVVTPSDHSAWILIATTLGLICSLFFGGLRVLVRTTISPKFMLDDYTLCAATVLATIQSSIILGACSRGLGKSVDLIALEKQNEVQQMYYTSNLFFIIALGLSKISVVFFLLRLSPIKSHKIVFSIALVFMTCWTVGSLFAIALQCNLQHPWISVDEDCAGTLRRWQVICALDIMSEVLIVGLAVYLVWSIRSSRSSKIVVVGIFSFRLLTIFAIAFRLDTFDEAGLTTNPLLLEASFIAWTQSQLNYSLVSATIPTFQNLLKNLNTQFGGLGPDESAYGYGSGTGSRAHKGSSTSYQMSKLRSVDRNSVIHEEQDDEAMSSGHTPTNILEVEKSAGTPGEGIGSEAANGETISIGSNESRSMMIRKDITWNIVTEHR